MWNQCWYLYMSSFNFYIDTCVYIISESSVSCSETEHLLPQNCLFVLELSFMLQKTTTWCSWCIFVMPLCPCSSGSCSSFYQCLGGMPTYWHPLFLSSPSSLNLAKQPRPMERSCYVNYKFIQIIGT